MLMRFDPFRELDQLRRQLWEDRGIGLPLDAYRRGDEFVAHVDLPGVDPESIDVTVERNVLEIAAERKPQYGENDQVIVAERPHGSVSRQLFLGDNLDTDRVEASYDAGVLTVRIPVAEQAKPHKIAVTTGSGAKEVGAGSG